MEILHEALGQGIAPAIIIAIYLIITKIIDNRRENVKLKLSTDITQCIINLSNFVTDVTKNIIDKDKEKCKKAIEDSIMSSALKLVNFVTSTIINNHIDINKDIILINIHNLVNAEFYTIYSTLNMYKINGTKVSDYLNKEWMNIIEKDMIDIIYNSELNKGDKVLTFTNKINIKFQSYITYINNNALK